MASSVTQTEVIDATTQTLSFHGLSLPTDTLSVISLEDRRQLSRFAVLNDKVFFHGIPDHDRNHVGVYSPKESDRVVMLTPFGELKQYRLIAHQDDRSDDPMITNFRAGAFVEEEISPEFTERIKEALAGDLSHQELYLHLVERPQLIESILQEAHDAAGTDASFTRDKNGKIRLILTFPGGGPKDDGDVDHLQHADAGRTSQHLPEVKPFLDSALNKLQEDFASIEITGHSLGAGPAYVALHTLEQQLNGKDAAITLDLIEPVGVGPQVRNYLAALAGAAEGIETPEEAKAWMLAELKRIYPSIRTVVAITPDGDRTIVGRHTLGGEGLTPRNQDGSAVIGGRSPVFMISPDYDYDIEGVLDFNSSGHQSHKTPAIHKQAHYGLVGERRNGANGVFPDALDAERLLTPHPHEGNIVSWLTRNLLPIKVHYEASGPEGRIDWDDRPVPDGELVRQQGGTEADTVEAILNARLHRDRRNIEPQYFVSIETEKDDYVVHVRAAGESNELWAKALAARVDWSIQVQELGDEELVLRTKELGDLVAFFNRAMLSGDNSARYRPHD